MRQEFGVLSADSMSIEADQFSFGFDYEPDFISRCFSRAEGREYGKYILVEFRRIHN